MISMVCPDMVVTMSPGRCALPSGMFSTSPIAPMALTLALRAASACMSPTTQAAPAMSPFMSSMPAAGLIEMPPGSKHTPLPMKATGAASRLPPVQRITATRPPRAGVRRRARADARQGVHAEPPRGGAVEHVDAHAEPLERAGPARELDRKQHVGRLIDEVAGEHDGIREPAFVAPGGACARHVGDADHDLEGARLLVLLLALGLVAVEGVAAQPHAERQRRRLLGRHRLAGQLGHDGGGRGPA